MFWGFFPSAMPEMHGFNLEAAGLKHKVISCLRLVCQDQHRFSWSCCLPPRPACGIILLFQMFNSSGNWSILLMLEHIQFLCTSAHFNVFIYTCNKYKARSEGVKWSAPTHAHIFFFVLNMDPAISIENTVWITTGWTGLCGGLTHSFSLKQLWNSR